MGGNMHVLKCDLCKKEIAEPAKLKDFGIDGMEIALIVGKIEIALIPGNGKTEICESCRNRLIRGIIETNFPLRKKADG